MQTRTSAIILAIVAAVIVGCARKEQPATADAARAGSDNGASETRTLTPDDLVRRSVERRAVEAAIWGMPVVNYDLMLQEMLTKTEGKVNQVIYWGKPLDWHNQTLTPNPDTIYFMAFFNTKDVGPIVIDVPSADDGGSLNANIVNIWQMPLGIIVATLGFWGVIVFLRFKAVRTCERL